MDDKNTVNPNKLLGDSPVENRANQNKESTVYLDRYKCDLWERRIGRYILFIFFLVASFFFLYYGLDEGRVIISKLSEFMNNGSFSSYSTRINTECLIYPVVICTLFLSLGLTLALTLLRATYRHPTDKNIARNLENKSIIDIATPVAKAVAETCKSVLK